MKRLRLINTSLLFILAALILGAISCRGSENARIGPPEMWDYWVTALILDYDRFEHAPVEIRLLVDLGSAMKITDARVDWGEGAGWEPVNLPLGSEGYYVATYSGLIIPHAYEENGDYDISLVVSHLDGRQYQLPWPVSLRIGPERRMFTDPRDGSTYEIYGGTVWVAFADWERLSQLDHDMAEEPDIAAFLEAENLRVRQEQAVIAAMEVILPYGGTVEEAVGEWPSRYPELIESVDPNAISELH